MGAKGNRWLIGCGSGCGLMVLLAALVVILIGRQFMNTFEGVEEADESWALLVEAYGDVDAWTPPTDGSLEAGRMQVFLAARELMIAAQGPADSALAAFPPDEFDSDRGVWFMVRKALGAVGDLVPPMADYAHARHVILMDLGMGPGEYLWTYTVAYHSWLGHDPADVPRLRGRPRGGRDAGDPLFSGEDSPLGVGETRAAYRRTVLPLCRNWLHDLRASGDTGSPIHDALVAEIRAFDEDLGRTLWADGPPAATAASLEPFRARLETSYRPHLNPLEWPLDIDIRADQGD